MVEAKAWDKALTEGIGQAKDYAGKLAVRFTYSANGQGIYGVDMATGTEGEQPSFPTPQTLWNLTFATENAWRDRFAAIPFEDKGGFFQGRYYQDIAIQKVLDAIADQQQRILLTLATGTGKTFIAFQIAWKLFHARWNLIDWQKDGEPARRPRVLFLADRNILADQAYNAFSAFPEDALVRIAPEDIRKKGKVPKNGSVFFTIFQTFISGPLKDGHPSPYFGEYPPDFFDLIVIDECHRGGANDESNWRGILEYFAPAVQLGLTATPKRQDNIDTYAYFGDTVVVAAIDRLGRDTIDVLTTVEALKKKGVSVVSMREGFDLATDAGKLMLTMLAAVAELERANMKARQVAGLERARAEGRNLGRKKAIDDGAVAAWREAQTPKASIKVTAEHFGISVASVKRACAVG